MSGPQRERWPSRWVFLLTTSKKSSTTAPAQTRFRRNLQRHKRCELSSWWSGSRCGQRRVAVTRMLTAEARDLVAAGVTTSVSRHDLIW